MDRFDLEGLDKRYCTMYVTGGYKKDYYPLIHK